VTGGPSLAVTRSGELVVAWIENGVVQVVEGNISTASWERPVGISGTVGEAGGDPVVAVNGSGDAVAAWQSRDLQTGVSTVQAAYRRSGGLWGAAADLGTAGPGFDGTPQVAIDGAGNGFAAWVVAPGFALHGAVFASDAGSSHNAAVVPGPVSDPRLAVDSRGNAVVAWIDTRARTARASVWPSAARAWQPPVTLSTEGSSDARVATDGTGGAVAVWSTTTAADVAVWGADLLGDWEPTLIGTRPPSIAGLPRVGRTLFCRKGEWEGTVPIGYAYAWLRDGRLLPRLQTARYTVRRADRGAWIACRVTATNAAKSVAVTSRPVRVRRAPR
jgi:hypothetical protein